MRLIIKAELEAVSVVICHVQAHKINSNYHIRKMNLSEWGLLQTTPSMIPSLLPCSLCASCWINQSMMFPTHMLKKKIIFFYKSQYLNLKPCHLKRFSLYADYILSNVFSITLCVWNKGYLFMSTISTRMKSHK